MLLITSTTFRPPFGFVGSFGAFCFEKNFPSCKEIGLSADRHIQIQRPQHSDSESLYRDLHSGHDPESSLFTWIPVSAAMTFQH
jgi:hypothetical protein